MPRNSRYPTIINELLSISIKQLRQLHFFKSAGYKSEPISFKSWNHKIGAFEQWGTIGINLSIQAGNCYVEFEYMVNEIHYCYQVELVQVPSNLAIGGHVLYFLCPVTKERFRKLYFYQNKFVSRKLIEGAMYRSEITAMKWRGDVTIHNKLRRLNSIILEGRKPSFKRHYRGKPTMRYIALLQAVKVKNETTTRYFNDFKVRVSVGNLNHSI